MNIADYTTIPQQSPTNRISRVWV